MTMCVQDNNVFIRMQCVYYDNVLGTTKCHCETPIRAEMFADLLAALGNAISRAVEAPVIARYKVPRQSRG